MWSTLLAILMIITAIFLILLVLIQRGRGGGLAGAFGGMGGQSAFGTKAGDLFTRITIGVAAFWIVLCIVGVKVMGNKESLIDETLGRQANTSLPQGTSSSGGSTAGSSTADTKSSGTTPATGSDAKADGAKSGESSTTSSGGEPPSVPAPAEKSDAAK